MGKALPKGYGPSRHMRCTIATILLLSLAAAGMAATAAPETPSEKERCPVCGMFVAKYPDFLALVRFKDGALVYFDGAKDMFKYLRNLHRYDPAKDVSDVDKVGVTDYYSLEMIDGRRAFYILGSDIFGPMGKELIPFQKEAEALEFMQDHSGDQVIHYDQITLEIIKSLD
ncbi:MAG: nitrous oxide reductase accessory protein NosL [Desulfosarcinaceae bacterium]|nr:nitrous oxide reductase accessory protein NosL [Desulfosarcinaceae bacterium]